jgi:hypothetical protein
MEMKPNYKRQRIERSRAKQDKAEAKEQEKAMRAVQRRERQAEDESSDTGSPGE